MKPQSVVTSAFFPTALAVASISLAILLLPGGGSSVGSSGLAPALKLVAGDVVTAVSPPVRAPAKAKAGTVVHQASRVGVTSSAPAAVAPVHSAVHHAAVPPKTVHPRTVHPSSVHHGPAPHRQAVAHAPPVTRVVAPAAPTPVRHGNGKGIGHDNGKGKALGRLGKTTPAPASTSHGKGHAHANGHSAAVHGNSGDTRHGPPAVHPGHTHGSGGGPPGLAHGRGGGK
jgi:hypothetical protein